MSHAEGFTRYFRTTVAVESTPVLGAITPAARCTVIDVHVPTAINVVSRGYHRVPGATRVGIFDAVVRGRRKGHDARYRRHQCQGEERRFEVHRVWWIGELAELPVIDVDEEDEEKAETEIRNKLSTFIRLLPPLSQSEPYTSAKD